eukprot:5895092-Amphidinium_carterae.1
MPFPPSSPSCPLPSLSCRDTTTQRNAEQNWQISSCTQQPAGCSCPYCVDHVVCNLGMITVRTSNAVEAEGRNHVPFRNSKLTHLMEPCLSGQGKTLMVVNISPEVPPA